jgi:hypothetical protein
MTMSCSSLIAAMAVVVALPVVASAEDMSQVAAQKVEAPNPGVQTAKAQAPSWCKSVKEAGAHGNSAGSLSRSIDAGKNDYKSMIAAAQTTCLWPSDPAVAHAVQVIVQHWMNWTGETQAQAIESITLRVNEDKFNADGDKLCKDIKVDDEVGGEEKQFKLAELALLGCRFGHTDSPLWLGNNTGVDNDLFPFLDLSETEPSELVRLANILTSQKYIFNEDKSSFDHALVSYAVMQIDLKAISDAGLTKALSTAPFANNTYARAVGIESEAMARLAAANIQKEVDARAAKDPDWKTLLVTAPQAGIKSWTDSSAKYKDQIAHSNAFEHKWYGPSKKAYAGCWKQLHDDFLTVLKDQKHATENEVKDSLQTPIVGLLFGRLVACASSDKDFAYVEALYKVGADVRPSRGARAAAYYAAVEAFGPIKADREKFGVEKQDLSAVLRLENDLVTGGYRAKTESKYDQMGWVGDEGEGTVSSTKKIKQGLEVTFVQTKQQFMGRDCKETNRIIQFRTDGSPVYYQNCHDTGLYWANTTPPPIVLPDPEWEVGVKPGAVIAFRSTRNAVDLPGGKHERYGLPKTIYTDKNKKKLVAWMGFAMP